jgi:hypothetical protein
VDGASLHEKQQCYTFEWALTVFVVPCQSHQHTAAHQHVVGRTITGTTAGKLQKFYAEHTSPRSGRSSPSSTALAADQLPCRLKTVRANPYDSHNQGHAVTVRVNACCWHLLLKLIQYHALCQVQGQDAVEHFAQHGLDAAPKLVHCVQAPSSSQTAAGSSTQAAADADRQQDAQAQHVYDLRLVQRCQLAARYFTISATGIVEVGTAAVILMLGSCQHSL